MKSLFKHAFRKSRFILIAVLICSLLAGFGIYYMITVDAMNLSLDSSWIWFLGATVVFFVLEIYFGHDAESGQSKPGIDPDGPEQNELH